MFSKLLAAVLKANVERTNAIPAWNYRLARGFSQAGDAAMRLRSASKKTA